MIKTKTDIPSQPNQKDMKILEVLHGSKKFNELEIETKKLIQKYPNVAALFNILGFALQQQGHLKNAAVNFEQAIFMNPKFVFAHNNLGNVFKDLGKFEEALSKYQHAIKLKPNYAEAYYNQALVYKKIRKYDEYLQVMSLTHVLFCP